MVQTLCTPYMMNSTFARIGHIFMQRNVHNQERMEEEGPIQDLMQIHPEKTDAMQPSIDRKIDRQKDR